MKTRYIEHPPSVSQMFVIAERIVLGAKLSKSERDILLMVLNLGAKKFNDS